MTNPIPEYLTSPTCWSLMLGSLLATLFLTPGIIRLARRIGAIDRGGYRKAGLKATPLLGGVAIAAPFLGMCALGCLVPTHMFGLVQEMDSAFLVLALASAAILILGLVDDLRGMRARTKLAFQVLVALFVCCAGHSITYIDTPLTGRIEFGPVVGTLLTVLWLAGLTNAFNIIDGLDGLAAGIALIGAGGLTAIAALNGDTFLVLLGITLASSLLAFLVYNSHPARVYLGDAGSMFLGFVLAAAALMADYKSQTTAICLPPVLVLGLPILETLVSMLRRFLRGRPIFGADAGHTHHRLLGRGLSQRQTVFALYCVALIFTFAGVLHRVLPAESIFAWAPYGLYLVAAGSIAWAAGYLHGPRVAGEVLSRRGDNSRLGALAHYAILALRGERGIERAVEVFAMVRQELGIEFLAAWLEGESEPLVWDDAKRGTIDDAETEELCVTSNDGERLSVLFRSAAETSRMEVEDIAACLVHIFESAKLARLSGMAAGAGAQVPHLAPKWIASRYNANSQAYLSLEPAE